MASKILLVEDDNNLREIYEARLQAEGYAIVTAKDGEEALVVAKAEKPDLIISDVMMPRISGFEMLDILRNTDELRYTKVIMLTALGQADDKTRADSLGADRYLVKSQVTLEDIVKAAHELTDIPPAVADSSAPMATASMPPIPNQASGAPTPATLPVQPLPVVAPAPQPTPTIPQPVVLPVATPPSMQTNSSVPAAPVPSTPVPVAPVVPSSNTPPITASTVTAQVPIPDSIPVTIPPAVGVPLGTPSQSQASAPVTPATPTTTPAEATPSATTAPAQAGMRPAYMTDFTTVPVMASPALPRDNEPASTPPAATTTTQPVAAAVNDSAKSTDDEKAAVGAQIADFANTPSTIANPPTPAPAPNPSNANHNTALDNAVHSLSTETGPSSTPTPVETSNDNNASQNSVTIANKKIIQPLKSSPKPDLNELLAREEARDTNSSASSQVVTPSAPAPAMAPTPPMPNATVPQSIPGTPEPHNDFDPNNIAL